MRIDNEVKLGFKDVLIRPKRSTLNSRSQVELKRNYLFKHSQTTWEGVPLIAANMDTVGTLAMAEVLARHGAVTALHKYYSPGELADFLAGQDASIYNHFMVSTGTSDADLERLTRIVHAHPRIKFICIDVANGYTEGFVACVQRARDLFREKVIVAGNVVTGEMVEELILSGADVVKVGIGPGSVCTTRMKTGVGYPQLSAIIECADAAHGLKGLIVADGGCTCAGDIAKAFGAGADFIMLGGMLAGHDESGGTVIDDNGNKQVAFYGMSSRTAMEKHSGGVADYRACEGKTVTVPYRGPVEDTLLDILGGLRSTCTYVGAEQLKELSKRTTFIRVMEQHNLVFGDE